MVVEENLLVDSANPPPAAFGYQPDNTLNQNKRYYRSKIFSTPVSTNPLVAAAEPIFLLITTLQTCEFQGERNQLFLELRHEIQAFQQQAELEKYRADTITAATYALCSLLDEHLMQSDYGKKVDWESNTLVNYFFHEPNGATRFFVIINRVLENTYTYSHLIELLYFCLSLGFAGKYRNVEHGADTISAITNKLYQAISKQRNSTSKNLLIHESKPKPEPTQININQPPPRWLLFTIAITIAVIIISGIFYEINTRLNQLSKPLMQQIDQSFNHPTATGATHALDL
jgi:type VI secretion system protein ImpK